MAATTLKQYIDARRWVLKEHGLQWLWNELRQITNSKVTSAGGVLLKDLIIDNPADAGGTTIQADVAGSFSGQFNPANASTTTAGGMGMMRPDPGTKGGFGPVPTRLTQGLPTDGFRSP